MHFDDPAAKSIPADDGTPWYKTLNRYQWFVLFVSALGWLFDTMDQQLFNLARNPAINELMGPQYVRFYGGLATTIFMLGWATGGIIFGIMGDRVGRAKTMVITILIYSLFTGLSSFSQGFWDFAFYRFLTGLGVGGEFAVGVALVAEVMPDKARPHALGWLQATSAIGNITAAFVSIGLAPLEAAGALGEVKPWRYMFLIGALPALLALAIRRKLKEPEKWQALRSGSTSVQQLGSFRELFSIPMLRRNAIVGLIMATAGVVGLWGIGFFGFELVRYVFRERFTAELRTAETVKQERQFLRALLQRPDQEITYKDESGKRLEWAASKFARFDFLEDYPVKDIVQEEKDKIHALVLKSILAIHKDKGELSSEAVVAKVHKLNVKADLDAVRKVVSEPAPDSVSLDAEAVSGVTDRAKELAGRLTLWAGIYGLLFNIGAFFGIYSFSRMTHFVGRKPAFAAAFLLALAATAFTFWNLATFNDVYWMVPIMGFFQISLFGGYAIYFPELFPTRLRSTGISFCYNVGRYIAAAGPLLMGTLAQLVFGHLGEILSYRWAGVTMCSFFLLGLMALPFAPETKDRPLPE